MAEINNLKIFNDGINRIDGKLILYYGNFEWYCIICKSMVEFKITGITTCQCTCCGVNYDIPIRFDI